MSVARGDGPKADAYVTTYSGGAAPAYNHPAAEITSFFGPLELVKPGMVEACQRHPDDPDTRQRPPREGQIIVGVARVLCRPA